jgi:hypothetical protein
MEFLSIFAVLAQRRILVALGVPLAALIAAMVGGLLPFGPGSAPGATAGLAQTRVMVDHSKAVIADTAQISDTVGTQAALLADLITGDAQRAAIARRAGISPARLGMQRMQLTEIVARGQLAERAGEAAATITRPYVVNVWPASPLPVLTIDAKAPTAAGAGRVATATREQLQALVGAHAPSAQRSIVIKPLGSVRALAVQASSRSKLVAVAAGFVFFVCWLCLVVILTGVTRAWRNATAEPDAAGAAF